MGQDAIKDEMVDCVAERFRALGDPTRIRILMRLKEAPCNVTTLAAELHLSQSSISKHLTVMRHVGILQSQREGTHSLYSIKDARIFDLCDLMCEGIRRHHTDMQSALGMDGK